VCGDRFVCRFVWSAVLIGPGFETSISAKSVGASIYIRDMECVFLHLLVGRTMAEAVSRRHLAAEVQVRTRVSPYGICNGQTGTGTGLSPSSSVFPCQQ
jgi:hypothetical protein